MAQTVDLPYFDLLFRQLDRGHEDLALAFPRHVHWGYWDGTHPPNGSPHDFARATERMCRRVCDAAGAKDGQRILDVGCGIGGTLTSLDERFAGVELVGLNIDPRQLAHARRTLHPQDGNTVTLCEGDACDMPFADESFDQVLAIECAFHFASRARFLQETQRVLRPGGRLALCDFVPAPLARPLLVLRHTAFEAYVRRLVGPTDVSCTRDHYIDLADRAGLRLMSEEDVTANMLPTYRVLRRLIRQIGEHVPTAVLGTLGLEWLGRLGALRYVVLSFAKDVR